jgi:predicted Zn-dependent protease
MKTKSGFIALFLVGLSLALYVGCKKNSNLTSAKEVTPRSFLSADNYTGLIVDVIYIQGYEPTQTAIDNFKTFLSDRLNKPDGITINKIRITSPGKAYYSVDDIKNVEKKHRKNYPSGNTLSAFFFFADGNYAHDGQNSKVLGVAYGSSSMAVFQKTVQEFSGGISQPSQYVLETTIMNHEFGHILGLVNAGTDMHVHHQDVSNGHHCNNNKCLMYYAVERSDIISELLGGNIPQLDANCIYDLQRNGGK